MKAYKGFNKNMTCRGFQYKEGETYETDKAELCKEGFHACLNPLDTYGYYSPNNSEYHEVEIEDNGQRNDDDTKVVGKKIKIGAKLSIAGICKAHFEYVKSQCNPVDGRVAGDNESVSVGNKASASAGENGSASAGENGSASAGWKGSASAGNYGSASAGENGSAVSRGQSSVGKDGVACVRGNGVKAKGGMGAVIFIVIENDTDYSIREWKAGVIDGENLKPDTWYTLENGNFVEVKSDD